MPRYIHSLEEVELNSNEDFMIDCPFCAELGKGYQEQYKLGISPKKGVYHCFKCGSTGSIYKLLKGHVSGDDILKGAFKDSSDESTVNDIEDLFDYKGISIPITQYTYQAKQYLFKRGLDINDIEYYNIRIGINKYKDRLLIPVMNDYGDVVYLTGRDYVNVDPSPKYLNPSTHHKSLYVWNLQHYTPDKDGIIITEGVFSGIAADKAVENFTAVCIFGKAISKIQAKLIASKQPKEIVIGLDGDVSDSEINKLKKQVGDFYDGKISVLKLYGKEDPNSISPEDYLKKFKSRM